MFYLIVVLLNLVRPYYSCMQPARQVRAHNGISGADMDATRHNTKRSLELHCRTEPASWP
eukprot:SAG31_NODE_3330_length_4398_cov_5.734589_7_plen_60_part_00